MTIFEIAALAAATLWAFGGMISATPSAALGAVSYGQLRMVMVSVILFCFVIINGGWTTLSLENMPILLLSGIVGIFLGDTALFLTLNRMGPRRTAILFSLASPIAALLGWMFLDEVLTYTQVAGIFIVIFGVTMAVVFGKKKSQLHKWEEVKGPFWLGATFGVLAALFQAVGSIIAKPALEMGVDPFAASLIRTAISAVFLTVLVSLPFKSVKPASKYTPKIIGLTALSSLVGMALGMSLFLYALKGGEVGIISTLSATTPAILLPLLWIKTKEAPAAGAWVGAALVVFGSYLLF